MPRLLSPKGKSVLRKLFPFKKIRPAPTPLLLMRTESTTPIPVTRDSRSYLEKQGWTLDTSSYPSTWHGFYRTRAGSWKGKIALSAANPDFYIYKPPEGLYTKHSHKSCFHPRSDSWCWVHFTTTHRDLDSGVIKLERILYEAYILGTQKSA